MKKLLFIFFVLCSFTALNAQSEKNLIEVGKNFYHFSNTNWDGDFEVNLYFTRMLENEKIGIRAGASFFNKVYVYNNGCCELGNVFDRAFFLFEASIYYSLFNTEKSRLGLHTGPLFRTGYENQVVNIIDRGTWTEVVTYEFSNTAPGMMVAASYAYNISPRWSLRAETGMHKFFQDEGTDFDFYGGLKFGFLF